LIRLLALIARRSDLSRAAFREHYENVHAPLAEPALAGLVHYVRNHLRNPVTGSPADSEPGFDVLSEFGYAQTRDFERVSALLASPRGDAIRTDELRFMDKPRNVHFGLEPRALRSAAGPAKRQAAGTGKLAILARRHAGVDRVGFLRDLDEALGAWASRASRAAHFETRGLADAPPWDAVSFLWLADVATARQALSDGAPRAGSWWVVAVDERVSRRAPGWEGGDGRP